MSRFGVILSNVQTERVEMHLVSSTTKKPIFLVCGFFEVNSVFCFKVTQLFLYLHFF